MRNGGLPSSVCVARARASFCCLWIVEITVEGIEEALRNTLKVELLKFSFSKCLKRSSWTSNIKVLNFGL